MAEHEHTLDGHLLRPDFVLIKTPPRLPHFDGLELGPHETRLTTNSKDAKTDLADFQEPSRIILTDRVADLQQLGGTSFLCVEILSKRIHKVIHQDQMNHKLRRIVNLLTIPLMVGPEGWQTRADFGDAETKYLPGAKTLSDAQKMLQEDDGVVRVPAGQWAVSDPLVWHIGQNFPKVILAVIATFSKEALQDPQSCFSVRKPLANSGAPISPLASGKSVPQELGKVASPTTRPRL